MDTKLVLKELEYIAARLTALRQSVASTEPKTPEAAKEMAASGVCLYCQKPLGKKKPTRGLHEKCYKTTRRRIESGLTTDAQLVQDGKLLPQEKQGRRVAQSDPVIQGLVAKAEQNAQAIAKGEKSRQTKSSKT